MAVNKQLAALLNEVNAQATGARPIAIVTETDFVSVATSILNSLGTEDTLKAISNVVAKRIYSTRAYSAKLKGLQVTAEKWGEIVQKLTALDGEAMDDEKFELTDGQVYSDQFPTLPKVIQTNFRGFVAYKRRLTYLRDQLDSAMGSSAEFGSFVGMMAQNISDLLEQDRESKSRLCLNNFIATAITNDTAVPNGQVIHLLTEYNTATGKNLTKEQALSPENILGFGQWVYARLRTATQLMTERSEMFHQNIAGKSIKRHTPLDMQNVFILNEYDNLFDTMVNANTYNDSFLAKGDVERVGYWQSIKTPDAIKVKPASVDANGALIEATDAVTVEQSDIVIAVLDKEAAGISFVDGHANVTPMNADYDFATTVWHEKARIWNDSTENGFIGILD